MVRHGTARVTRARQLGWRAAYELLAVQVRRPEWAFMNYGWAGGGAGPRGDEVAAGVPATDRYGVGLYERLVVHDHLRGRDVLEVGSGRGGGAAHLASRHAPRRTVGVDLSAAAVRLSRRHRRAPGLEFVRGDAARLPFPDASFDVVVNVESSHCYADVPAFLAEVRRVLRPGGVLLLADFRPAERLARLHDALVGSGLVLDRWEDVTDGVVRALRLDDEQKARLLDAWLPRVLHPVMRRFAAMEGSRGFAAFDEGRTVYVCARLVRPAG